MKKRFITLLTAAALSASCLLAACDSQPEVTDYTATPDEALEMEDISSMELIADMKIGWNLGNTLDASDGEGLSSETSWGNPVTTKEMIDTVKAAGFNVLRIPITWSGHFGEAPDYTIDEEWLNRVTEVVNYGIENDMYVIINMHHEDWHFPSYDNLETASAIHTALWTQIAEHFKNYDEHLIFESLNEPRKIGTAVEWTGGDSEGWDFVNQLNAAFVETIRSTGGNNSLRHLMLPAYAASSSQNALSAAVFPDDDKVIVSVHAYTPYNFALNEGGTSTFDPSNSNDTRDIDNLMAMLDEMFISKGRAVIIGEFGARSKANEEERAEWVEYYINSAKAVGIPCIWWDNNAFFGSGELFGLLRRGSCEWMFDDVLDAMMEAAYGE